MNPTLRDLIDHQLWADAQHWEAIEAHAPAGADIAIRERLHHLHLAQRSFVWVVSDRSTAFETGMRWDTASIADLRAFARGSHEQIVGCRDGVSDDARLADPIEIPRWFLGFSKPPLTITVGEALTQMAMHSQWHRGQNATRLRELGAQPPTVDLIVWYWKGRPAARL
jgi:uncharacterized damage-inducible protein DinB